MKYFVVVQMQGFSSRKQNQAKIQQVPVNSSTVANCLQSEFEKKAIQLALPCRSVINPGLSRLKLIERPTELTIVGRHFEIPKQQDIFASSIVEFKIRKEC